MNRTTVQTAVEPRIELLPETHLVGMHMRMSLADNAAIGLWKRFMPRRREIAHTVGTTYVSMQVFDRMPDFSTFTQHTAFERWAAVVVSDIAAVPDGMASYTLAGGLYAVFVHRGLPEEFPRTAQCIFGVWLPASDYALDNREHFEVLEEHYSPHDPDAQEEIWVPVRPKASQE